MCFPADCALPQISVGDLGSSPSFILQVFNPDVFQKASLSYSLTVRYDAPGLAAPKGAGGGSGDNGSSVGRMGWVSARVLLACTASARRL